MAADGGTDETTTTDEYETTLSNFQVILVYCTLCFSAGLSLIGSTGIITVARRKLTSHNPVYQRLMISLSTSDVMLSLVLIAGRWMVPSSTGDPLAKGNTTTCTILGIFVLITGLSTCIMCNYLSVYFLLTTKYGWREWEISQKLEKPAYALGFVIVATYVSCAAGLETIHPPPNVGLCSGFGEGPKYDAFIWIYTSILTIFAGGGCAATYMVYRHVYVVTQASRTHDASFAIPSSSQHQQEDQRQARVRRVARQAIAYYIALLNTLFWPTLYNILVQYSSVAERAHEPLFYLMAYVGFFLYPLQGACNFVIYIQYRVKSWKRSHPQVSWITATWWAVVKPMDPPNNINSNIQTSTASSMLNSASAAMWSIPGARRVSQLLALPFSSHQQQDGNYVEDDYVGSSSDEEEFAEDDGNPDLPWWQRNVPTSSQLNGTLSSVDRNENNATESAALETVEKQSCSHGQATSPEQDIEPTTDNSPISEELAMLKECKLQAWQPVEKVEAPKESITHKNSTLLKEGELTMPKEYKPQFSLTRKDAEAPQETIADINLTVEESTLAMPKEPRSNTSQPEQDIEAPQELNVQSTFAEISSQLKSQDSLVDGSVAAKESDHIMNTSEAQNDIIMQKLEPVQPTGTQHCEEADIVALSHWLSKWDHSASGSSSFNEKYTDDTEHAT
ncbi:expressed unknown protein [Seminavis robusta]|uniref:Uncharacterized protein n=1 Tax=Seminavis robusta TaxID=568900 RepID=A0A9N8D8X9_9STRA|nr:expressed unknown protein [Seminavis robusta]|eukprot:Sro1_g000640.1 n/a (676) ;mRNA; f:183119-185146